MSALTRRAWLAGLGLVTASAAGALGYRAWRDREPAAPPARNEAGALVWRNWSGVAHAYPQARAAPASEGELAALLRTAQAPIRAVGAGHSFTALAATQGTLLSLDRLTGLVSHDAATHEAVVRAGTRLGDLGPALSAIGQEMANLPDINRQTLAGAMATGTHGTGQGLRALHGEALSLRIVTPRGDIIDCDTMTNAGLYQCARVGLGAFGIVTQARLRNKALTRIRKRVALVALEEAYEQWPALVAAHRNAEMYVIPFTGLAATIVADETDDPVRPRGPDQDSAFLMALKGLRDWLGWSASARRAAAQALLANTPAEEAVDEGWRLLSNDRPHRFNEMEYHLPADAQIAALREVMGAIETHRSDVFFPIEVRRIAPDEAWLSPFYQRESGSIAVHAYYKDDHQFFFDLIEPIFHRHDGRPHWGKLHSLRAPDLAGLYPRWREAMDVRRELDPDGRLLNDYLRGLLIDA